MKTPVIHENYRDDPALRKAFFDFIRIVFPGIDFNEWYRRGFWRDSYIPCSAVLDDTIVSNVCVMKMRLIIDGRDANGIQIGAVGTVPEFRNRGLSRMLMEYVVDKYEKDGDIMFLFANDTVLDYYPRFGFLPYDEFTFVSESARPAPVSPAHRLNVNDATDVDIIQRLLRNRLPITKRFGALDYDHITWWHILNIYSERLYYVESEDVLFIMTEDDDRLCVHDVVYDRPCDIASVLPGVINRDDVTSIVYNFPPDQVRYAYDRTDRCTESPLFVRGSFMIEGQKFKFPVTAQT